MSMSIYIWFRLDDDDDDDDYTFVCYLNSSLTLSCDPISPADDVWTADICVRQRFLWFTGPLSYIFLSFFLSFFSSHSFIGIANGSSLLVLMGSVSQREKGKTKYKLDPQLIENDDDDNDDDAFSALTSSASPAWLDCIDSKASRLMEATRTGPMMRVRRSHTIWYIRSNVY